MASTSDIRKGLCIKFNNDIYKIVEFLHVKPGKGPAFVRTKLKSVTSGKVVDNTFSAGHKIDDIRVETSKFQYLYGCLLYTSPSPRDRSLSRMPSSA